MASRSQPNRDKAEAQFTKKQLAASEGEKAMAEYRAAGRAVDDNMARLKALRLAKEAAEKVAKAAAAPTAKAPRKTSPRKPKS